MTKAFSVFTWTVGHCLSFQPASGSSCIYFWCNSVYVLHMIIFCMCSDNQTRCHMGSGKFANVTGQVKCVVSHTFIRNKYPDVDRCDVGWFG